MLVVNSLMFTNHGLSMWHVSSFGRVLKELQVGVSPEPLLTKLLEKVLAPCLAFRLMGTSYHWSTQSQDNMTGFGLMS